MSWLRTMLRSLRGWFPLPTRTRASATHTLEVMTASGTKSGLVTGIAGLRLLVRIGSTTHLIGPGQCTNQKEFVRIWGSLNGQRSYKWEDGTTYDPWSV